MHASFTSIVQCCVLVGFPGLAVWGAARWRVLHWLSPVVLCYVFGILLANIPDLPLSPHASAVLVQVTVALAIPLLLFGTKLTELRQLARPMATGFGIATVSVMLVAAVAAWIGAGHIDEAWKVAGMLVGDYTGGSPNLTAIGLALGVHQSTFVLLNGADMITGAVYLLFLMTVAKPLLGRLLQPFGSLAHDTSSAASDVPAPARAGVLPDATLSPPTTSSTPGATPLPAGPTGPRRAARQGQLAAIGVGLALAVACDGLAVGLSYLIVGSVSEPLTILTLTTLGIAAAAWRPVRTLPKTYDTGEYLLLVFCVAIGTLANVHHMLGGISGLLLFTAAVLLATVVLHFILAWVFRLDVDTAIIASTAAVFGPPFVAPIANALDNREVVAAGITAGVLGLAAGNYLGMGLAYLARAFLPM